MQRAHKKTFKNRVDLIKSDWAVCFCCQVGFHAVAINEWTDDGETAKCPSCNIDSVIGNYSDFLIDISNPNTLVDFMKSMHEKYFKAALKEHNRHGEGE